MRTARFMVALIFTLVILAACVAAGREPTAVPVPATPVPPTIEIPTATPTVEVPTPTVEPTLTYTDTEAGFALDYPAAWAILPVSPEAKAGSFIYSTTLMSWPPDEAGVGGSIPDGQTKVDVTLIKSNVTSLDAAVAERKTLMGSGEGETIVRAEEVVTLPSGLPALRWELESQFANSVEYIVPIKGNIVLLSGLGDVSRFDGVARSLRPLE